MLTLADFRRALTIGSKWSAYNHVLDRELGIREVGKIQSKNFAFKTIREGKEILSWCEFPKKDEVNFTDDGSIQIFCLWDGERRHILTYKKIKEEQHVK